MLRIDGASRVAGRPSALALIVGATILLYANNQSIGLTIPVFLTRDLGGDPSVVGVVGAVSTGGAILGRVVARWLVARWNPLRTAIVGALGAAALTASYPMLESAQLVAAIRFLHLGAFAIVTSTAVIAAATLAGPNRRGAALAGVGMAMPASALVFPAVASEVLGAHLPTVAVMATFASVAGVLAFAAAKRLRNQERPDPQPVAVDPATPGRIPAAALAAAVAIGTTDAVMTDLLPVLGVQRGIDGFGLFYTAFALAMIVTLLFLRRSHWGRPAVIVTLGLTVSAVAFTLLATAYSLVFLSIAAVVYGAGFALSQTALAVWLTAGPGRVDQGRKLAGLYLAFDLGRAGGVYAAGWVATGAGFTATLLAVALYCAVTAVVVRSHGRRTTATTLRPGDPETRRPHEPERGSP